MSEFKKFIDQKLDKQQTFIFAKKGCDCHMCLPESLYNSRMIVCSICGNKRCPHANDHRNACTNSNEPGQPGSAY